MSPVSLEQVRAALALDNFDVEAARRCMAPQPRSMRRGTQRPGNSRQASVLILLYPLDNDLAFVLVRRTENEHDVHSGQIGLPGGSQESGETMIQTALRETQEEVGVSGLQVIGSLTSLYISPSDFDVHPVVGYLDARPVWRPDPAEVAEVLECPLAWLLDDGYKVVEDWDWKGYQLRVPWYNVRGHKVWGATAIILSELEQRLRAVSKF
ncbi:MAG: CoA pyrophosphatase [Anaerolineae bacterium]|nr:CoA pyrophosphatase [Anaerolineae bacterium]